MKETGLKKLGYTRRSGRLALLDPGVVAEAPEKVLEAVRLAAESGLEFEPETQRALRDAAAKLGAVPPERIGPHWRAFAEVKAKRAALEMLDALGGVESMLAEVHAMKGVEQPPQWHPEGDVWVHTLLTLEKLGEGDAVLTTATLLHDVGKPVTYELSDRIRFNKHESVGGRMARKVARRLGFGEAEAEDIEWVVRAHMKFKYVREMRPGRLKNLVLDARFDMLARMVRADCLASHGDTSDVDFAQAASAKTLAESQRPKPLLRGRDLLEMGFEPGPEVGRVLKELESLRERGRVKNRADAKKIAGNFLKNR